MTTKGLTRVQALLVGFLVVTSPAIFPADKTFTFVYLQHAEDPFYERHRAYTGLMLRDRHRPFGGAMTAIRESRIIGRALGFKFKLVEKNLEPQEDAASVIDAFIANEGVRAFLLDLPLDVVTELGAALADRNVLLFNIRHPDDRLRGEACSPVLFHTLPSYAMLMDALAQFLFRKKWTEVLVLEGEEKRDKVLSAAFQRAARKFRLKVADVRPFVLSNDPRMRGQINIPLLTGGKSYDVVFLADTLGEFGRYVPYNTQKARPVVGSEGLTPDAWHWTWERHGAPQLNQRFDRTARRRMQDQDYAAWVAVKVVVEAIARTKTTDIAKLRTLMTSDDFTFDTYKGAPGNFRSWDNQLRQAILLRTYNAVVARAPIEGFLHQRNDLDTLGTDKPESICNLQ
ncbi:MAG: ABC transporter substrate-binding protein [Acidiferrobacterales bacterium]